MNIRLTRRIVLFSVFAGLGKTTVGKKYTNVCDLQSSPFRCIYDEYSDEDYEKLKYDSLRASNPDWPDNYLGAVQIAIKKYDIVLVPSSLDVRNFLMENNIEFVFVMPSIEMKDDLLSRYIKRGNSKEMIDDVMTIFDTWSRDPKKYPYKLEVLQRGMFLEDLLIEKGYLRKEDAVYE